MAFKRSGVRFSYAPRKEVVNRWFTTSSLFYAEKYTVLYTESVLECRQVYQHLPPAVTLSVLAGNDLFLGKRGHDTLYSTGGFSDLFGYLLLGNLGIWQYAVQDCSFFQSDIQSVNLALWTSLLAGRWRSARLRPFVLAQAPLAGYIRQTHSYYKFSKKPVERQLAIPGKSAERDS